MDHHYCPCFYTKQWTNINGKLVHYTIVNDKVFFRYVAPRGTGYETDLYAKKNTPEHDKHTIETGCYKNIDNDAAKVFQKIIKHGLSKLTEIEKTAWCRFIVSMMTRHPSILRNAKAMEEDVIDRQAKLFPTDQQAYYQIRYKNEIEYWKNNAAVETLANMSTFQSKYALGICERYAETLLKLTWWIEDFSKTSFALLTSDYPVAISPLNQPARKFSKPTEMLLSGDYLLSLPLTPQLCFYAATTKIKILSNSNQVIKSQNNLTVLKARNFVYACDTSQDSFIKKRLQLKIKPTS